MPRLIVHRRAATATTPLPVGTLKQPNIITLFPNQVRKEVSFDASETTELIRNLRALRDRGVIGFHLDLSDRDPNQVEILSGFDMEDGDTANTSAAYRVNLSAGRIKDNDAQYSYPGAIDLDPIALGIDSAAAAPSVLADGNAYKIRWYFVRTYTFSGQVDSYQLMALFGDPAATADLGTVSTSTGYLTDAQVTAAFAAKQKADAATKVYVNWIEIGRQMLSRSGAAITATYKDLKAAGGIATPGLEKLEFRIQLADLPTALTYDAVLGELPENCLFFGGALRVDTPTDLVDLTVQLGKTGQLNELFDAFDIGTGGSAAAGYKNVVARAASPVPIGGLLAGYKPNVRLTSSGNLDTTTDLDITVILYYLPLPEVVTNAIFEVVEEENKL